MKPYRKTGKRILMTGVILTAVIILTVIQLYRSKHSLSVSYYTVSLDHPAETVRIVQLTDLHNSGFGEKSSRLIGLVREQDPDLILLTGDLLNEDREGTETAENLIRGLSEIAPVYASLGNHEIGYEHKYGTDLRALYADAGARVLDFEWTDTEVKNLPVRLGGLYGYCLPAKYLKTGEARENETAFLSEFQNTDRTTILMCHMPVCWILNESLDEWNIDLVFSGHAHGGQIIIPYIGGLWAPDQGWLPGRLWGVYPSKDEKKHLILSRGLGSNEIIPRFNNIPEITVVDLIGQ